MGAEQWTYIGLLQELEHWKNRALAAEARSASLSRKLEKRDRRSSQRDRGDPRDRFRAKFTDG